MISGFVPQLRSSSRVDKNMEINDYSLGIIFTVKQGYNAEGQCHCDTSGQNGHS